MSNVDNGIVDVAGSGSNSGLKEKVRQSTVSLAKSNPVYRACHTMLKAMSLTPTARKRALGPRGKNFNDATRPKRKKSFFFFKAKEGSR